MKNSDIKVGRRYLAELKEEFIGEDDQQLKILIVDKSERNPWVGDLSLPERLKKDWWYLVEVLDTQQPRYLSAERYNLEEIL